MAANHQQEASVWLVTYKKDAGADYVSTHQVLDELLCFGWINGIRRKLDHRTMQLIFPRKTQHWTKTYKYRAQKLIKLIDIQKMQTPGLKPIEQSKENGLWHFMDDVDQLIIPLDLRKALSTKPNAKPLVRENEVFRDLKSPSKHRHSLRGPPSFKRG